MKLVLLAIAGDSSNGARYAFAGARGTRSWPMANGNGLGAAGAYNALLRLGFTPKVAAPADVPQPAAGDVLFAAAATALTPQERAAIDAWLKAGGSVVASGTSSTWGDWLPGAGLPVQRDDRPFSGLACLFDHDAPELAAPPQWDFVTLDAPGGDLVVTGSLAVVHGERQTPGRAAITPLPQAPAIIRRDRFIFLNGNPFAAFQAWLQGQDDLEPWLEWRHRLFWLDEHVVFIWNLLRRAGVFSGDLTPGTVAGLGETTVVLRHDLDHSRDTTYLELEREAGVPGVHAVLDDENTAFWRGTLAAAVEQESAFHYNTARSPRWANAVRTRVLGRAARSYAPERRSVVGRGLLKQVQWARRAGVGIATIHRHLSFIYYPEYVDALDFAFENEPALLGGSSFFRASLLRWGADRVDGARGTYGGFPGPQFPFWFPFRMAHAADGGRLLRGWESASVMESEPALVERLLGYRNEVLRQRVIVLTYHPAHARRPNFTSGGSVTWFTEILAMLRARNVAVRTLRAVFEAFDAHAAR